MIEGVESSPFLLAGIGVLHDHSVGLNAFGCSISRPDMSQSNCARLVCSYFQLISGPAEPALDFHTFIQQHKSVRFPEQSFDPVTTFYRKIQGASPWIHMELILYNSTQPVNGFPHIRSACYDIDFIGGCDIPPNIPTPSQCGALEPEAEDLFHLVLLDENFLQTASLALLRKGYFFP